MLIPLVVAATLCAQTHVPYLPLGAGMIVLGLAATLGRRAVRRRTSAGRAPQPRVERGHRRRVVDPAAADQLTNEPGNLRELADHFGSPPEAAIGLGEALRIMALRHLDAWYGLGGQLTGTARFVDTASQWRGAVTFIVWVVAAAVAFRHRPAGPCAPCTSSSASGPLLGTVSMARIFGRPWFYLTLWAWGVTTLLVGAVVWTAVAGCRHLRPARDAATAVGVTAAAVALVVSLARRPPSFVDAEHPEERLSTAVGSLAGPTYDAVVAGVGAATGEDGRYLVRWSDAADIGSPGFGLLDELERRGLDVAADEYFRVPATEHRTRRRADADAQIHLATGRLRRHAGEPSRTPSRSLRTIPAPTSSGPSTRRSAARSSSVSTAKASTDLVPLVDTNLFGMSIDTRLSAADQRDLGRLIELGQPMAVFVAPPPADDDPTAL